MMNARKRRQWATHTRTATTSGRVIDTGGAPIFGVQGIGLVALIAAILLISAVACRKANDSSSKTPDSSTERATTAPSPVAEPPNSSISSTPISPTPSPTSGDAREPVPTTGPLTRAETAIDRSFVPESTTSVRFEQSTINGVSYANALLISICSRAERVEINAGRGRSRFLGELGVPDDQRSASAYKVDVSFDVAAPVLSTEVRFGETRRLDLDVTNVLRIRIVVSPIAEGCGNGSLAIGNPRFR